MKKIENLSIYLVSLGCAKNRVDSEKTLALLLRQGCVVVDSPKEAQCVIINSCGFINDARAETVETILELAEIKKRKPSLKLAVMGCMVELFKGEMAAEMPEIDYLLSLSDESLSAVYQTDNPERVLETGAVSAYLKIAEGCGNSCSFCSIPAIRGPLKSRTVESIIKEAEILIDKGVKELCLVSQDTTRYGADLKMKNGLVALANEIVKLKPEWIRILYAYPTLITDELLRLIAFEERVCKYVDVPFQHIETSVLKRMGRRETKGDILSLIEKIRKLMPNGAIRTSFIVGFPGETEKEFEQLESFLIEAKLDHVGVFTYSPEAGTKAFELNDDVEQAVKEERRGRLMEIQRQVSSEITAKKVGTVLPAIIERYDDGESLLIGRLSTQAPDVDGELILTECESLPGDIIDVKIIKSLEYDLVGKPA